MEAVKRISPRAEQLISEYGLGHVRAEYRENLLKMGLIFTALFPVGLIMLALTLPTLLALDVSNGDWWQRMGNLSYFLFSGSCLSLLGLVGVPLLVVVIWKGEKRLYLGDKGFVIVRRQVEMAVRWEMVLEIRRRISFTKNKANNTQKFASTCLYTIVPNEGKKCSIDSEPGPEIEESVTAEQLPRALESYASGKTLSFGWLTLSGEGLHLSPEVFLARNPSSFARHSLPSEFLYGTCVESGERFLPWEKLVCYWIDESRSTLILSRQGERKHWAIIPLYQIVNPALCLALIEHVCYSETRETA